MSPIASRSRAVSALVVATLAIGCAQYPKNPVLERSPGGGYRFESLALSPGNTNETFVVVTLSGGGTRAAAFSYGALAELERWRLPDGSTLLDEVDVVSSVSGGSFAAAYLGAFGKRAFLDGFPSAVLHRKIQRDLLLRVLAPWNWWKLASHWYGRSDLASEYYGEHVFERKRYGDLPRERPLIQVNATDIGIGARFSFVQQHFDRLCSDLDGVALARGVTASSAFPVAFTPLTLKNYGKGSCGYQTPGWVESALADDLELSPSRYDRARAWQSYEDAGRKFIHLSDGGLADNIGSRGPMLGLQTPNATIPIIRQINRTAAGEPGGAERVALILVDAKPHGTPRTDRSAHPPGILTVLSASATTPMENYSADSVEIARRFIEDWRRQFLDAGEESPVDFFRSHVRFDAESDPRTRQRLQGVPTALQLPDDQVALLTAAGSRILCRSQDFQKLVASVGAVRTPEAGCPTVDGGMD